MSQLTLREALQLQLAEASMVGLRSFLEARAAPLPTEQQTARIVREVGARLDTLLACAVRRPDAPLTALAQLAVIEAIDVACHVLKLSVRVERSAVN